MSIEVLKPGALTTLQDLGRHGYQHFGVVVGGVMDEWSHQVANALVGNRRDEASIEITWVGPSLRFTESAVIAIVGADLAATANGLPLPLAHAVALAPGAQIDFGRRVTGVRTYLAVAGGFDVAPVLGSRSTYLRGGFGGFAGRALRAGDVLPIGRSASRDDAAARRVAIAAAALPSWLPGTAAEPAITIRAVTGRHAALFTPESLTAFHAAPYRIHPQSDRMGYRLEGPRLQFLGSAEVVSEGVTFGTVQVPPDGNPIVLMADRQTIGGYAKIGSVAAVDLPLLAQLAPRQSVRFETIDLEHAQTLYRARALELAKLRASSVPGDR